MKNFKKNIVSLVLIAIFSSLCLQYDMFAMKQINNYSDDKKLPENMRVVVEHYNKKNKNLTLLKKAKSAHDAAFKKKNLNNSDWDKVCESVEQDNGERGEYFFYAVMNGEDIIAFMLGINKAKFKEKKELQRIIYKKYSSDKVIYVRCLAVHPGCQKHGWGKRLTFSLFKDFPNTEVIFLYSYQDKARAFYKHIGFTDRENWGTFVLTKQKYESMLNKKN